MKWLFFCMSIPVLAYESTADLLFENLCVNFQYRLNKFLQIKKKEILLQSR